MHVEKYSIPTEMRSMIHKQSIVGAEVHSEANLPSTSHQNPNPFSQQVPTGQEGGVLR